MINTLRTLVKELADMVRKDLKSIKDETIELVLRAYNDYEESERDSADYIFSIESNEDVITCLQGGMGIDEVVYLRNCYSNNGTTEYFMFGHNHEEPSQIRDTEQLVGIIGSNDELFEDIIKYPYAFKSYEDVYRAYITDTMLDNL